MAPAARSSSPRRPSWQCGYCSDPESSRSRPDKPFSSLLRRAVHTHGDRRALPLSRSSLKHSDPGILFCGSADFGSLSIGDHRFTPSRRTSSRANAKMSRSKPLAGDSVSPLARRSRIRHPRSRALSSMRQLKSSISRSPSVKVSKRPYLIQRPKRSAGQDAAAIPAALGELGAHVSRVIAEKDQVTAVLRECEEQARELRSRVAERRKDRYRADGRIGF